jgi:TonB-linked SusC/RagA family outer membrane protein
MQLFLDLVFTKRAKRIMKYICVFVFIGLTHLHANVLAQHINLSLKNATIKQVIDEVEKQCDLVFMYDFTKVDVSKTISIRVKNEPVENILNKITDITNSRYEIVNRQIVLLPKKDTITQQKQITIKGTITDETGEIIPGVHIVVKGTSTGFISDSNGNYSIDISGNDAILIFSYMGYSTREVPVGDRTVVNVVLYEDSRLLEEVVVVGYGVQKKENLTGSVVSVDMSTMTDSRPITSLSSGLAGLAAGVTVTSGNGGQPGNEGATIRVRGQGTLNNSDPLVIIDGVTGNINDVNPQDVESISVLKDAASSSIYGSRAANGVILITTKKGREGVARITYHGYLTSNELAKKIPYVTNYADHMELINEGYRSSNVAEPFSKGRIDEWRAAGNSDPIKYPNSDWQDFVFQQAWMQNHTLTVNGGADKLRYFVSGNYLQNPGIMENSGYDRFSVRVNLDANIKSWFKLGVNSYGYRGVADLGYGTSTLSWTGATSPGWLYRHPDGRFGGVNNDEDMISGNNPLRALNSVKGNSTTNKMVARFFGQLTPFKGLIIEGSYTYDFTNRFLYQQPVFNDQWNFYDNSVQFAGTGRTSVTNSDYKWMRNQMDVVARYEKNVSSLNIQAMVGASDETYRYQWFSAGKSDLTAPELTELNAATMDAVASGDYTNWAIHSFFSRLGLNWAEKYLFEANLRIDYSSRFAPGKTRRGIFPSFSAGWRLTEEGFMREISWLNNLKLRASYGALGNNAMGGNMDNDGNYNYLPLYSAQNYPLNNAVKIGWAQTALSNAAITWETTYVSNLGLDFGMLNSKLNGSFDFFVKNTKDILINLPFPLVRGNASIPRVNAGEVRNTGVELSLSWNDKIGNVQYFISGNSGYVKNKLTKFQGDIPSISGTNMLLEGYPINVQYLMKVDRLVQTDEDLAYVQSLVDKKPDYFRTYLRPEKGDFLYEDTNGDGDLTADDRVRIGNGSNPTLTYGVNFGASWNGFDFSCLLQGVSGYKVYWNQGRSTDNGVDASRYTSTVTIGYHINKTVADGRWYEGRPDKATFPRLRQLTDGRNNTASDFWMVDRSYLRIKNIQLGYTAPKSISQKIMLENIRFYVSVDNALTFTKYPGLDPERSQTDYPTFRMTSFGINLTF